MIIIGKAGPMASVTDRVVSLLDGAVWVQVTYDDTTRIMSLVESGNSTGAPAGRVLVSGPKGTLVDAQIPAGSNSWNVPGRRSIDDYNIAASAKG